MSLLQNVTRQAIEGWMEESHPLVDKSCCLNKKQRKFVCTECRDICPHGVYDSKDYDWDLCENCGLCVVACPSQAICPSLTVLRNFLRLLDADESVITIGCNRSSVSPDLQVSCLAAVPWELIARIAIEKTLVMDIRGCVSCDRVNEREQLLALLSRAEVFLGADHFNTHVCLDPEGIEGTGFSRREAFSAVWSMFRKGVANLLPDEGQETPAYSAFYRKMLAARLRKMEEQDIGLKLTWETPVVSDACTACSVCEKICVHGAIELRDGGDGENMRHFIHSGYKCVHCSLCETLCPAHAIEGWTTYAPANPLDAADTVVTLKEPPEAPKTSLLESLKKKR